MEFLLYGGFTKKTIPAYKDDGSLDYKFETTYNNLILKDNVEFEKAGLKRLAKKIIQLLKVKKGKSLKFSLLNGFLL